MRRERIQSLVKKGIAAVFKQGLKTKNLAAPTGIKGLAGPMKFSRANSSIHNKQKKAKMFSKLALEYDIDKIIPKREEDAPPTQRKLL